MRCRTGRVHRDHDQRHGDDRRHPLGGRERAGTRPLPAELEDAEDHGDAGGGFDGTLARPMQDLGGRHVAEPEAAGDVGQRAALDRRLPQRLAFA